MPKSLAVAKILLIFALSNINIKGEMEEMVFRNRREQMEYYAQQHGWGPMTEEDRAALDDAVRMITNLDSKPRYAISN